MQKLEESSSKLKPQTIKKSVVVIDDSIDFLYLIKIILQMDDYEIFTAQSGKEAFKVLSEMTPNLILLDMQMDDMSGTDFLIKLEEMLPDLVKSVPVVFLTGMSQVPKSKASGFIRKPIDDIPEFLKQVRNFIDQGVQPQRINHNEEP